MYCYFCWEHGHTHPVCPQFRLWQIQKGGQQEMEHLLKLGIISPFSINFQIPVSNTNIKFFYRYTKFNNTVLGCAPPKDLSDFISCIEEAFSHCSPHAGGVLIRPKWHIDPPDLGGDWPKSPVSVLKQKFIKRRPGVYTTDYKRPSPSRVELFHSKATLAQLDKAGSFDISTSKSFWNSALSMFDEKTKVKNGQLMLY